jgi:two-component system, response regulator
MTEGKLILLVEDNPDDELLTLRAFKKTNLAPRIVVARDGVEALDFVFGTGAHAGRDTMIQPQVILLDLNLPRINGHEVLARIRADARSAHLPVVVLTSSAQDEDLIRTYANGTNAYVRKPVDYDQFVDAVKTLGLFWLALNKTPPRHAAAAGA